MSVSTPNPPTNIVDFRRFGSSIILVDRGGIPRPIGDFPETLNQAMLVGTLLVGGLGIKPVLLSLVSKILSRAPHATVDARTYSII